MPSTRKVSTRNAARVSGGKVDRDFRKGLAARGDIRGFPVLTELPEELFYLVSHGRPLVVPRILH